MKKQMIYGYMRVSSKEQNEDRQKLALLEAGVPETHNLYGQAVGKRFCKSAVPAADGTAG